MNRSGTSGRIARVRPDDRCGGTLVLNYRLGLSPVMIGRQPALGRLRRLAVSPRSELALVSGEAGIGKTRLLRELVETTDRRVLAGTADPTAPNRPLALVDDLLASADAGSAQPDDPTQSVLDAVGGRPSVVVFEDLHWADAASAEVFERLAQLQLPDVLLIGTYRSEDLSRRLPGGDMLARLERRHDVTRIHLDRLSRSEVSAFLASVYGRPLPSAVTEAMYERTGGNPFFLEELAGCCNDVPPEKMASQPLPWSLEEVVRRQLDGLSLPERRLAEAAAVLGPSASFDVLAAVAELHEDDLLTRLRALVDDGILIEHHEDQFTFRHALVRDAVEKHLLGRERRRLHERALELLAPRPDTPRAELARHAAGAGRFAEMVDHARAGAVSELRERGSTHLALRLAADALAEEPDDPVLLEVVIEAAWLIGLHDEALAAAQHLERVAASTGSLSCRAAAARWLVRLHHDRNEDELSTDRLGPLEALLDEPLEPIDRARTLAALAQANMLRGESEAAVRWADLAIAEATAIGADEVRVQALIERGSANAMRGHDVADLEAAAAEAERLGLWVLATRGLNNLFDAVWVHTPRGQELLERFRAAATRAGFDSMTSIIYLVRMIDLGFGLGDIGLVEDNLARAVEWTPLHRFKENDALTVRRYQLDLEYRRQPDVEALARLDPTGCLGWREYTDSLGYLAVIAAVDHGDRGELDAALARVSSAPTADDPNVVIDAIDAAARAGVDHELIRHAAAPEGSERDVAAFVDGVLAHHAGHHDEAVAILRAALGDPPEALGAPLLGRLWTIVARSEVARGHRHDAAEAAAHAQEHLAKWAGWRVTELAELLARLEAPAAQAGRSDAPGELTAREREVAVLLAEGLSNGEIAKRLYISPKTASVHVSNILMKLGMANRAEIAAWAVRTGLADA